MAESYLKTKCPMIPLALNLRLHSNGHCAVYCTQSTSVGIILNSLARICGHAWNSLKNEQYYVQLNLNLISCFHRAIQYKKPSRWRGPLVPHLKRATVHNTSKNSRSTSSSRLGVEPAAHYHTLDYRGGPSVARLKIAAINRATQVEWHKRLEHRRPSQGERPLAPLGFSSAEQILYYQCQPSPDDPIPRSHTIPMSHD